MIRNYRTYDRLFCIMRFHPPIENKKYKQMKDTIDLSVVAPKKKVQQQAMQKEIFITTVIETARPFAIELFYNADSRIKEKEITFIAVTWTDSLIDFAKALSEKMNLSLSVINAPTINALYFEDSSGCSSLIVRPDESIMNLGCEAYNFATGISFVDSLREFATENRIPTLLHISYPTFYEIVELYDRMMGHIYGIDIVQILGTKLLNTLNQYTKFYLERVENKEPSEHNHLSVFSEIYYLNVKVMADVFRETEQPISIHDVATCMGHFPLMLSRLSTEDLMGLNIGNITISDIFLDGPKISHHYTVNKQPDNYRPVNIIYLDLIKNLTDAPRADVIMLNDVLEHFEEEQSFKICKEMWHKTNKLLLIHVPLEETPDPVYDHITCFSPAKLREWASRLEDGTLISENYKARGLTLTDLGFLIMQK